MNLIDRRLLTAGLAASASSILCASSAAQTATAITNSQPTGAAPEAETWMDSWTKATRDVAGALTLSRFADPIYMLLKPITWTPNVGQNGFIAVTAPIGFVTDFASVPRAFWSMLRPDGLYAYAAIIHDYLYWYQPVSKGIADSTFKLVMQEFDVSTATIETIYSAVRLGGASAWNENARLRQAGEKRTLKSFPNDPRIRWADWKKNPANFL